MEQRKISDYTMIYNSIIRTDKLDTYQKSCINNILSNEENFKLSLNNLSKRIPCSQRKLQQIINTLKELNIISVEKIKSANGDWDCNRYLINIDNLFRHIGVENNMPNVENDMPNGRECNTEQVENNMPTKNTNKNINIENKKERETSIDKIINSYTENLELGNTLKEFLKMRKSIKKPMTDKAMKLLINKLDKLGSNDNEKIEILNQSIFNSWQGIFELKNKDIEKGKAIDISDYITK